MPLFSELSSRSVAELLRAFDTGPAPADAVEKDEMPLWLDEVATALAEKGDPGLSALLQRLSGADEPHARAILMSLAFLPTEVCQQHRAELEGAMRSFLKDPRPAVVAEAVDALRRFGYAEATDRIRPLLNHPAPEVVGSALRFLARHAPAEARPALLQALQSPEPLVRENAADELDDLQCVEALPQLRRLLNDENEDVRQAVRTAVQHLEEVLTEKQEH